MAPARNPVGSITLQHDLGRTVSYRLGSGPITKNTKEAHIGFEQNRYVRKGLRPGTLFDSRLPHTIREELFLIDWAPG